MRISVKILFGDEHPFEVTSSTTVLELKSLVNEMWNIPLENQKLLLNGRALVDNKVLSEYGVKEGTKITVFVCQPLNAEASLPATTLSKPDLHKTLYNKFRLFYNDEDSLKVVDEFMNDFQTRMATLSLNDIERLAKQYLDEDHANLTATESESDEDKN